MRTLLSAAETLRAAGDPRAEQLIARAKRELAQRVELVRPERRDAFLGETPAGASCADAKSTFNIALSFA
ncbi:MAG: hypothetical protein EOM24_09155 [Chloroflexia bacterium]|nr:hypothetical protein [Chloroflexia bacterium]